MSRKRQSQWDFGELFPSEQTRRVLTVAELTTTVRKLVEKEIGEVWVTGEVTNLRQQASGHCYFTLKDAQAQLSCVLFRGEAPTNREFLTDGQKLLLQGSLTVYEARGQYQLIVRNLEPQGIGALQLAFEKLKRKLQMEGLFAQERKRPLPRFPQRIGLVTSPSGAAIRDVLHVIQRRQPSLEIILAPCRVQGDGAAAEIAAAIRLLNSWSASTERRSPTRRDQFEPADLAGPESGTLCETGNRLDLILVTRGGGSLEDLWAFNEEVVARAIFESALPVVSAVGHEIDFTISDFVADLRAATPSAAAELITEAPYASRQFIESAWRRMRQAVGQQLDHGRDMLLRNTQRLARAHPRRQIREHVQYVDDLSAALGRSVRLAWREHHRRAQALGQRLNRLRPSDQLELRAKSLRDRERRIHELARRQLERKRHALSTLSARLRLLSPENVLARGYSVTVDESSGCVIRTSGEVKDGQVLKTRLSSGFVRSIAQHSLPPG